MPVGTINAAKELAQTYQPLLLAEFTFQSGAVLRVASHPLNPSEGGYQYGGYDWLARVMSYDITATQALAESGIDYTPQVSVTLADVNRDIWANYEQPYGFKGAMLTIRFVFWNVGSNEFSSDSLVKFVGVCGSPQVDTDTLTVSATSLMNMSQAMLPQVRVQKRCPWIFPITASQRQEAADDESSPFYQCGYSVDATGGNAVGNLNGSTPYKSCNYTYTNCINRLGRAGQYIEEDGAMRPTGRFGGIQENPPNVSWSRGYVSGKWEEITTSSNEAKYGDLIPLHYGEGWTDPLILSTQGSDANFTKITMVLGWGAFSDVSRVLVNGVLIPHTYNDGIMAHVPEGIKNATEAMLGGWWVAISGGSRNGNVDPDISVLQQPDPYGNLCVIQAVVPRKLADSSTSPRVQVLAKGPKLRVWYFADPGIGAVMDSDTGLWWRAEYTDLVAWVMLDVLTWAHWRYRDIDIPSFINYAAHCGATIEYKNHFGVTATGQRYTCTLIVRQRRSAAEIVRGLRNAGKALLYLDTSGKLTVKVKETLAGQQPAPVAGSNYNTAIASTLVNASVANGYVAYSFDESNIAKRSDGKTPTLIVTQRGVQETPNRVNFQFQDRDNHFVPDTLAIIDAEDVARVGQEVTGQMAMEGINSLDQGRRCAGTWMAENYRGNSRLSGYGEAIGDTGGTTVYEWETTFKVIHLNIGDICQLSYQQLAVSNQLVRIIKIQPSSNFSRCKVTALHHNDRWYHDEYAQDDGPLWKPDFRNRELRPAMAWCPFAQQPPVYDAMRDTSDWGFSIAQDYETAADGTAIAKLVIGGRMPVNVFSVDAVPPFVGLQGTTAATGGTLAGGRSYWFMVCAVDAAGKLSAPSRMMTIAVPSGTNTNTATIPLTYWPSGAAGYKVFGGHTPNRLSWQAEDIGTPSSVTLTGLFTATWGVPDSEFNSLLVRAKRVIHGGVWGQVVTAIDTDTVTVAVLPNAGFAVNQWAGYTLSLIGQKDADEVPLPIWNATIASNTADGVLTLATLHPYTANVIHVGDVVVCRFLPTVGSDGTGNYIEDAGLINMLGGVGPVFTVAGATNASPIVITTDVAHPFQSGDTVYVDGVGGNTAANGAFTAVKLSDYTLSLTATTGTGAYTGGGTIREMQQGLLPGTEDGMVLFFTAGTGKGMTVKVKSNTATRYYVDGKWPVTPDVTSRFIVLEPGWQVEAGQQGVNNALSSTLVQTVLEGSNYRGRQMFVQGFTVDGGGDESPAADSPFREIYVFGGEGAGGYSGAVYLLWDGPCAIGSDLAPVLTLHSTSRAVAVRAEVKQAPTGADLTCRVNIGVDAWMTLVIPDGQTVVEATSVQIDAAVDLTADTRIKLDILTVGTTTPGQDLTVTIYI